MPTDTIPAATASDLSSAGSPSGHIVVRDGVESPAPGRWTIPPQSIRGYIGSGWTRRHRSWTMRGALVVAAASTTLELESVPDSSGHAATPDLRYQGTLVARDRTGRWRFEGEAAAADRVYPLAIEAAYHGVFRSGARGVAWLVLTGGDARVGSSDKRVARRLVRGLTGGLNAVLDH